MANFDKNSWYQMNSKAGEVLSFTSSDVIKLTGSAFFQITNTTKLGQQWQLFPSQNNTYVMRNQLAGPTRYLTAHIGNGDKAQQANDGNTVPIVSDVTVADDSMFWTITPWGDGSFYMSNAANGSNWHLEKLKSGLMAMTSNFTEPHQGQGFVFKALKKIDNTRYSTLKTPTSTPTATPSLSSTSGAVSLTDAPGYGVTSSSNALSVGAVAGIGVGVGLVLLLALVGVLFLFLRWRKRKNTNAPKTGDSELYENVAEPALVGGYSDKKGFQGNYAELPSHSPPRFHQTAELHTEPSPIELDDGVPRTKIHTYGGSNNT